MPELPEVETVRRGLIPALQGQRLVRVEVRRPNLRLPFPPDMAARLTGRTITAIDRRAKYLLFRLDGGEVLIVHLGMSGRMVIGGLRNAPPGPHEHVEFVTGEGRSVTFADPRRFGLMVLCREEELSSHSLLKDLGPEPLEDAFSVAALNEALVGKKGPIKTVLLDQHVVSGLGNIYVCEALFRAGIDPTRPAQEIAGRLAAKLVPLIKQVLAEAIEAGGSSLRDHRQPSGELGYFQHNFAVYGREGEACPGCDCDITRTGGIARIQQAGRSTFYCAKRQK